jgi:hypothetical protein
VDSIGTHGHSKQQAAAAAAAAGGGGDAPGPLSHREIEAYGEDAEAAAAMHAAGQQRLQQLLRGSRLPRQWQRRVAEATEAASWDLDTKIKVGAGWGVGGGDSRGC